MGFGARRRPFGTRRFRAPSLAAQRPKRRRKRRESDVLATVARHVTTRLDASRRGARSNSTTLEIVAQYLASLEVEFEPINPVTQLLNAETGGLKYPEVRKERVLSAIIEFKTNESQIGQVLRTLETAAKHIETVFSVSVISRCCEKTIPILSRLQAEGYQPRVNGKTNLGLGRPLRE